jgi:hypothetical protein
MLISAPKVTVRLSGYQSAPLLDENFLAVRMVLASRDDPSLRDVHRRLDVAALRRKHVLELFARRELTEQMESHMSRACPLRRS